MLLDILLEFLIAARGIFTRFPVNPANFRMKRLEEFQENVL